MHKTPTRRAETQIDQSTVPAHDDPISPLLCAWFILSDTSGVDVRRHAISHLDRVIKLKFTIKSTGAAAADEDEELCACSGRRASALSHSAWWTRRCPSCCCTTKSKMCMTSRGCSCCRSTPDNKCPNKTITIRGARAARSSHERIARRGPCASSPVPHGSPSVARAAHLHVGRRSWVGRRTNFLFFLRL